MDGKKEAVKQRLRRQREVFFCVAAGLKSEQQNKEGREGADGDTPTEPSYVNAPKCRKVNGSLVSHTY